MGEYNKTAISCRMCGVATYGYSDRVEASGGKIYCNECAGNLGLRNSQKNNCAICGKVLSKAEVKMVLPSKSFSESTIPLEERLACMGCYSTMATRSKYHQPVTSNVRHRVGARLYAARAPHRATAQQIA